MDKKIKVLNVSRNFFDNKANKIKSIDVKFMLLNKFICYANISKDFNNIEDIEQEILNVLKKELLINKNK